MPAEHVDGQRQAHQGAEAHRSNERVDGAEAGHTLDQEAEAEAQGIEDDGQRDPADNALTHECRDPAGRSAAAAQAEDRQDARHAERRVCGLACAGRAHCS